MSAYVTLFTIDLLQLTMVVTDPDERAPNNHVLTTYVGDRRIARRAMAEHDDPADITEITKQPRQLMYAAWEDDPGIVAELFVLVPDDADAWKRDLSEKASTDGVEVEGVFLGQVVRAKEFRIAPDDLMREALDHFSAILGGKTVEPIEQMLKRLA